MLEKITHIEGLDEHQDHDLSNDTNPGGVFAKFGWHSEEMPFETAKENRIIRKNFLVVTITQELGRTSQRHRVRDYYEVDPVTKKVKNLRLLPHKQSYIRRFPEAWNAFYRGTGEEVVGTPLEILFKNDPSKVEAYKFYHITVVEQLANLNETDATNLGMGGRDDVVKAQKFLERAKAGASSVELVSGIDDMKRENATLRAQVADLSDKLRQLLEAQLEKGSPEKIIQSKKARPKKVEDDEPVPAGIEGV